MLNCATDTSSGTGNWQGRLYELLFQQTVFEVPIHDKNPSIHQEINPLYSAKHIVSTVKNRTQCGPDRFYE